MLGIPAALAVAGGLVTAATPRAGWAYVFAVDQDGEPLRWQGEDPIPVAQHYQGGQGQATVLLHGQARKALETWAELETARIEFEELGVYTGQACPHDFGPQHQDWEEENAEEICGVAYDDYDFVSAIFFMETEWPFGPAVIALTTVSWSEGARIVDADIACNGVDWAWSVDDQEVEDENLVDYQSIILHESGHVLGLDHSPEPGAVMRIDYSAGSLVRDLGEDDIAGISLLYPCDGEGPCGGRVSWQSGGCAGTLGRRAGGAALGGTGLAALALLLLGLGLRRRAAWRATAGAAMAAGLVAAFWLGGPREAETSVVAELAVEELAERADSIVRGRVACVRSWWGGRIAWTEIELDVEEAWKGGPRGVLRLVQPGGAVGRRGTRVFGMPQFEPGEEVVLFTEADGEGGERVLGLAQGKFRVGPGGALSQDLSGLRFARLGGAAAQGAMPATRVTAPATLAALRGMLQ